MGRWKPRTRQKPSFYQHISCMSNLIDCLSDCMGGPDVIQSPTGVRIMRPINRPYRGGDMFLTLLKFLSRADHSYILNAG